LDASLTKVERAVADRHPLLRTSDRIGSLQDYSQRIRDGSCDGSIRKSPHGQSDSNRPNQLQTGSTSKHHDGSVSLDGDLVLRTFLVMSRNQKMAVIVAE
jgi:hypothetical protein